TTSPAVSLNATGLHIKDGPSVTKDGIDAGGRVISNVAAGVKPTDAVNVSQLNKTRNDLINRMDANHEQALGSAAMAMAMANLPHAIRPGDKTVSVAGSTVHGKAAFAVGISSSSLTGKWQLRGSVSGSDNGDIGAGIGAGYTWR
ncbi:YadA-like family protein, partial [Taylorella asinigenitalis]|uniref:YadA-like family protein n=1 Tax=Taylorella asinigenitalis TaxID=84590 RepID=UPI001F50C05D